MIESVASLYTLSVRIDFVKALFNASTFSALGG